MDVVVDFMSRVHPNSILNLPEAEVWHLLIDETGSRFNAEALTLPAEDHQVGRVVGLLHPEAVKLPLLPHAFHATDSSPYEVHHKLRKLLKHQSIGILGATIQLSELEGRSWINAVQHLVRWVLALLPASGAPITLKVFIEQRAPYREGADLRALAETLKTEMKSLSPQRLANLNLNFQIIPKTGHPHNGYVDSLAYVWGSPKPTNRKFIEETELLDGCLIESESHILERLFLIIQHQHKLTPVDWYQIASTSQAEREGTILEESLQEVALRCQVDVPLWELFLSHCADKLERKEYHPHALLNATDWLAQAQPDNTSSIQKLRLKNTQLAAANHLGRVEQALATSAHTLAMQLFDENAQIACQTFLRTIVMHCNNFNFEAAESTAEEALKIPVAMIGKKNYGKLLSSMGQIYAFKNDAGAPHFFQQALEVFLSLHDQTDALADINQTRNYQLIWLMDQANANEHEVINGLCDLLNVETELDLRKVAIEYATGARSRRFSHYLLLRACIMCPEITKHIARAYWSQQQQWQSESGHPWQLIALYRGMLIWRFTNQYANTKPWIEQSILLANAPQHSGVLHVMGSVINDMHERTLASEPQELEGPECFIKNIARDLPFTFH